MGSVNLVVAVESVRTLIEGAENYKETFNYASIIAVGSALGKLNHSLVNLFFTP
jgi:hypothetical protein